MLGVDRCFPGDRYDCFDDHGQPIKDGQHWVRTDSGPRAALPLAESQTKVRALIQTLAGHVTIRDKQP